MLYGHAAGRGVRTARRVRLLLAGLAALVTLAACDSAEERKQSHYESGLALVEAGEPDKALLEFTNVLRIDDEFVPAHEALGRLHADEGRLGKAVGHLEIVADARPEDLETRIELARILLQLRAVERARTASDAALALAPDNSEARALRAAAGMLLGETDAAVEGAELALEADPSLKLARLTLAAERLRADDPEAALALIDAAPQLQAPEGDVELELVRVRVLERMGDREGLGEALRRLVERRPEEAGLRTALARWHMQGDPPDLGGAEAELRALAALSPDDPAPKLRVVGFLRGTQGEAAARAELERLIEAAGEDSAARARFERELAMSEARAGETEAAVARLEAAVEREGASEAGDAARLLLARLVSGPDAPERRVALIEAVLSRDSANVEALAMRAELAIRDDRPDDAIQDLRAALEGSPRDPALLELLARAHERNGDDALAAERRALAVQAAESAPGPSLRYARQLVREGKLPSAESVLLDALRAAPRNRRLLGALAEVRLRREDWDGARQVTEALADLEAQTGVTGVADQLRAASLFGEGRVEESIGILEEMWETRGAGVDMNALARAYALSGDLEGARAFLERIREAEPDNLGALALLAQVEAQAGDVEGAEATLRAALEAAPENPALHRILANFLQATGRPEAAEAAIEAGLAVAPGDRALRLEKAIRLELAGGIEPAIAIYEALYAENPDDVLVANNLASLLSDNRDDAESLERAKVVARRLRGSSNPAFLDTYGWTLHLAGDSAQAVAVLRETAPALAGNATAQYHLGMAYAAIDQADPAIEQLRRALELADGGAPFPQRAEAAAELARLEAAAREVETETDRDG
ncbi:MAG TPA: tetratricopeptide repeat protein [Paracoccaceae bacterium]|nr:tetratricopeptide repeat protein [Paracoccaceae bacterium]